MKKFGLIGRSLSHSFSPDIHRLIGGYEYNLYPIEPDRLGDFIRDTDLDGLNVTIPYKTDVIPYCSSLSERAARIGSVNTLLRTREGWLGDNTDYAGFRYMLGEDAYAIRGKKALVLGSGGASRTVRAVLADLGAEVVVISRSGENGYDSLPAHADAFLIVNTTPLGMYPGNGKSPVDLSLFPACRLVLDLIYNPARTALLLDAEEREIPARGGLGMLAAQGVEAGGLFLGRDLPPSLAGEIAGDILRRTLNIVLVGMPGCGKSTVARLLGNLTGRQVADTDDMICERAGMSVPEFFENFGEAEFRRLETGALRDVSKESGKIIATGGGVVSISENRRLIRQNSICVFLDRDPRQLDISGRPLSAAKGIERLLAERLPLYRSWCDITVNADNLRECADMIKQKLKL